jgi:hypothetical membrane protein
MNAREMLAGFLLILVGVILAATLTSIGGRIVIITIIVLAVVGIWVRFRQGQRQMRGERS